MHIKSALLSIHVGSARDWVWVGQRDSWRSGNGVSSTCLQAPSI